MKAFFMPLRRQEGFTLVELMVVVAIIGLLSAVAVPNFKKYQAKSKMSEAKLQLSAAYTAEQSFFSDFNLYHHCLTYMGYDPGPEANNRYYAIGFPTGANAVSTTAYTAAQNSGLDPAGCPNAASATAGAVGANSTNPSSWFPANKGVGANIASTNGHLIGGNSTLTAATSLGNQDATATMTFIIGAGGVISQDFNTAASCSKLQITQAKVLTNPQNGY